ncbi:MAG: hypothetical protein KZQ83_13350 [gamma proteobacterium symbiont of Taylorina sp.]|nr:hypothetical protein [gamma proteobacterium symbiont of Taylorina sp.]
MIWEQVLSQANGDVTQVTGKMIEAVILSMGLQTLKDQLKPSIEAEVREELSAEINEVTERCEAFRVESNERRIKLRTLESEQIDLQNQIEQLELQKPQRIEVIPKGFASVEEAIKDKQGELKKTKDKLKETEKAMLEAKNKQAAYEKTFNEAEANRKEAAIYLKSVENAFKNLSKILNPVEAQEALMVLGRNDIPRLQSIMGQVSLCLQTLAQTNNDVILGELAQ